jgi:hypothetical protein
MSRLLSNFWLSVKETYQQLDEYWFGYGSPVTIGVMRILIGITVFCNLFITFLGFDDWYTEHGFVPVSAARIYLSPIGRGFQLFKWHLTLPFDVPRFDLIGGQTDARITMAFWIITLLACITMTFGLWSRTSAIILSVCVISLHHRNAMILHGGDTVQRLAVMYMALAPCGKACSLDRLIGLYRGKIAPGPQLVSMWPQRLISFNLALIYFTSVWHKWGGDYWRLGDATWFTARLNEFKRFWVPDFVNQFPMVKLTTYGTLATELAMGTLVFYKPLRKYVLLAGLLMHGFIEYSMNIPLFSFSICALYITFYEGDEVVGWFRRIGARMNKFSLAVSLPKGTKFRPGPEAAITSADPLGLVSYEMGEGEFWVARDARGGTKDPFSASRSRSLGGWVVALVPGLWRRMLLQGTTAAPPEQARPSGASKVAAGKARR